MGIVFRTSLLEVDWARMKETLASDNFDNGRTAEQLRISFENSYVAVVAYDVDRIVGTGRALSDGVCNSYIVDVWTLSDYRNQGIARTILTILEQQLEGQHIYLFSEDVPEFYRKLGFRDQPTGLSKVKGKWLVNRKS
jgi:ribosomal protein S18 acetylase RimI-like enzyme